MPRGQRKEKKARDPTQPKRPLGAYMIFAGDKRAELKQSHPYLSIPDIGRHTGAFWNRLTEQGKQKYKDLAAREKERYEEEMLAWAAGKEGRSSNQQTHPQPRSSDDSNRPKKPQTAYMWFATDHHKDLQAAHPEWGIVELGETTRAMWKELSDDGRKMYADKAAWDQNRYEEEMKAFEAASVLVKPEPTQKSEPDVKPEPDLKPEFVVKPEPLSDAEAGPVSDVVTEPVNSDVKQQPVVKTENLRL